MADVKISELTALSLGDITDADVLPIVNSSETKKVRVDDLINSVASADYLKLDQTSPQTVLNDMPIFNVGIVCNGTGTSSFNSGIVTTTLEATDVGFSIFNGGVKIKAGQKLIFDSP